MPKNHVMAKREQIYRKKLAYAAIFLNERTKQAALQQC
jgi:hypothetical protein